jgi:hypothetical protein
VLFTRLHALAAPRGDGLRPELADALDRCRTRSDAGPKLVDLASYRGEGFVQSGPNPTPGRQAVLPDGVIRFPGAKSNK